MVFVSVCCACVCVCTALCSRSPRCTTCSTRWCCCRRGTWCTRAAGTVRVLRVCVFVRACVLVLCVYARRAGACGGRVRLFLPGCGSARVSLSSSPSMSVISWPPPSPPLSPSFLRRCDAVHGGFCWPGVPRRSRLRGLPRGVRALCRSSCLADVASWRRLWLCASHAIAERCVTVAAVGCCRRPCLPAPGS
jgi:hypothetical protein